MGDQTSVDFYDRVFRSRYRNIGLGTNLNCLNGIIAISRIVIQAFAFYKRF